MMGSLVTSWIQWVIYENIHQKSQTWTRFPKYFSAEKGVPCVAGTSARFADSTISGMQLPAAEHWARSANLH